MNASAPIESPVEWVQGKRLAELTGLTTKAMDRKRQRGIWREGFEYRKMDGHIYYSIPAYNEWASGRTFRASNSTATRYVSRSRSKANAAAKS